MTDGEIPADELSPAEERLSEYLELLRADPPVPGPDLIAGIVRRARWQAAVRDPLVLVGTVASALGEGVRLLFGRTGPTTNARHEEGEH